MIDMINQDFLGSGGLLEQILWWIGSFVAIGLGIMFATRMKKYKIASKFMWGLPVFSFTYGIARVIENIRKYIVSTNPTDIYDAWVAGDQITGLNYTLRIIYYIICWTGIATFYLVSEKYVFKGKTHYLMTVASLGEGVVSILNYIPGLTNYFIWFSAIGFFIAAIFPIVLYLNMAKQNTGIIRNSCIMVAVGILFFVIAVMGDLPESLYIMKIATGSMTPLPVILTSVVVPISLFIGVITMAIGFRRMFTKLL
jgi:hypothetical protein